MKKAFFYETKFGNIGVAESDGYITNVFFGNTVAPDRFTVSETPLLKKAGSQLKEYIQGERTCFDLPLCPDGTEFEKSVWEALKNIPYGQTRSYLDIARQIGNPKACRAVGRANGRNPISLFIPCHRVIGRNGRLVGYAGGVTMKKALLEMERKNSK